MTAHRRPDGTVAHLVLAHLAAHPQSDFTAMELHRVLGPSRGAIIRACQQLATAGRIRRTRISPQRYQALPTETGQATHPTQPTTDPEHRTASSTREGEPQ